jgi:DNA topoisomerase VI subunit B
MSQKAMPPRLARTTFRTSRLLDFLSRKELIAQTGHQPDAWPLVVLKELVDNALDACEEAKTPPKIAVTLDKTGITVTDNGPGLPATTLHDVQDFSIKVSSREAYVAPTRGAQGNALKTILAMPFVLDQREGTVEVSAHGVRHTIRCQADPIRQLPVIDHQEHPAPNVKIGTVVRVWWPNSACSLLEKSQARFLQMAEDFTWLNPHLSLTVHAFAEVRRIAATDPTWAKWGPSDPTSPHWYTEAHLTRLVAAYIAHDQDASHTTRMVRDLVSEFKGLAGTAKQKLVLEATGMARTPLAALGNGHGLNTAAVRRLLAAMREHSKPVPPTALGVLGRDHLARRFKALGCATATFHYIKRADLDSGLPWVLEAAFGWLGEHATARRLILGVNWSPGIGNPFRELGAFGTSLDAILERQRAGRDEPVALLLHVARPRVEFADRGKTSLLIETEEEEAS